MRSGLRSRSTLVTMLVAAGVLVGTAPATAADSPAAPAKQGSIERTVNATLDKMSLPEKVGQLFVTYAYGDTATTTDPQYTKANQAAYGVDNGAQLVAKYHLGGIIDFTWTGGLQNPQQIAGLSNGLQQAALAQEPAVPLLISTDQEGGNVVRVGAPAAVSPGNMAIGASFSPGVAFRTAAATGTQLRALGINVDDAPVVDVNTNPANAADGPRAFGDNTPAAAAMGAAAIAGYQSHGVAATAKHFPGLGSTSVNTDSGIAVTDETRAQIFARDIPSFRSAIAAGADMIMAAHIVAPALDPTEAPASMSKPIVTGILRNQLHFQGVVITDSLGAGALNDIPAAQRAVRAIEAGDDELLMPESLPDAYQAVLDAVSGGQISVARINESVRRILTLKARLGLFDNPCTTSTAAGNSVGATGQLATMADAARRSITLVKNDDHILPLTDHSGQHVLVTGWGAGSTQTLTNDISAHGVTAERLYTGTTPGSTTIAAAVAAAKTNDVVVVTTDNASANTAQQTLVTALLGTGKPVVVAALGTPYDIGYFNQAPTFVAAYGYQDNTLAALADALFGAQPTGRLPVTVPLAGDVSQPLYRYGTGLHY